MGTGKKIFTAKTIFGNNLNNFMKTLVIYAGSFNPFTIGHLNIAQKAENIFGKGNVLIAIGQNPTKEKNEDATTRAKILSEKLSMAVELYSGFLHDFIQKKEDEGFNVVLVRGLRNGDDLSYEDNQLKYIRDFKSDIKVVFIRCDDKYDHISSSAVRALELIKPGSGNIYLI